MPFSPIPPLRQDLMQPVHEELAFVLEQLAHLALEELLQPVPEDLALEHLTQWLFIRSEFRHLT